MPGTLAYGTDFGLLRYETDSSVRHWLGPIDARQPAWSPDGQTLLYLHGRLGGLCLDPLDGAFPTVVPNADASEYRWSPDGSHFVFVTDPEYALCTMDVAGSDVRVLDDTEPCVGPRWSPDGQWIAYNACGEVRLIRPDGSEGHAVSITEVAGYPGTLLCAGGVAWSPDSQRLAMRFAVEDGVGNTTYGIGVAAREGGLLTPVFVDDADHVGSAAAHAPVWSPEGKQIVFSSGRHLAPNPAWADRPPEPGVELWVIRADGSGEPQRLTYDGFDPTSVTWWMPQSFTDVPPYLWGYAEIEACAKAGLVTGYPDGAYQPKWGVTRGQTAAFLARAMCGGDDLVPTGPAEATFPDVPTTSAFFRHVEYAFSQGVVKGYADGAYQPAWAVNRGQMAAFLARALVGGEEYVPTGPAEASFSDVAADFGFYRHIEYLSSQGVTTGYQDGTFHPEYACDRDQTAVFVARAFHLIP